MSIILEGRVASESRDGELAEVGSGDVADVAPGHDSWVVGDVPAVLIDVQGVLGWAKAPEAGDRFLTTLLFTDIVGSTEMADRLGDRAWKQVLQGHDGAVRGLLEMHRGRVAGTTGDGLVATFDAPARAIRCAMAIAAASNALGVQDRIGVHTGEVEMTDGELRGQAVHLAMPARHQALRRRRGSLRVGDRPGAGERCRDQLQDRAVELTSASAGERRLFQVRGS